MSFFTAADISEWQAGMQDTTYAIYKATYGTGVDKDLPTGWADTSTTVDGLNPQIATEQQLLRAGIFEKSGRYVIHTEAVTLEPESYKLVLSGRHYKVVFVLWSDASHAEFLCEEVPTT